MKETRKPEKICEMANHVLYRYEGDTIVYARTFQEWEELLTEAPTSGD